ncbi:DUF4184 family protein [Alkalihalobacillus macyae]|uniref:DUF4184 family protein n=1 Tax=Guptibacillus hwajinpoensis TaxID=208199 RepID=UPI00273AF27C|nr:DUF4184 family protein [Alkalihalobacillus macyae]MDP4549920.1 DUF4184 family protein [Alkalihalobacillus macyae]
MNTLHHAFWSYFFFRKKKRQTVKYIVIGGIAPDIIYYVMFLYLLVERSIQKLIDPAVQLSMHYFIHGLFEHPVVDILRKLGHSIVIWAIAFIVLMMIHRGFKLTPLSGFIWGWFLHVVVDFFTHVSDAVPIFYPVYNAVIPGVVSYWNSDYFGTEFSITHGILLTSTIIYLLLERRKTKRVLKDSRQKEINS